jgi:hypothetical protein
LKASYGKFPRAPQIFSAIARNPTRVVSKLDFVGFSILDFPNYSKISPEMLHLN